MWRWVHWPPLQSFHEEQIVGRQVGTHCCLLIPQNCIQPELFLVGHIFALF